VLRSKSPELVKEEVWGHLCCHYAVRTLMWDIADHHIIDSDQVSFITALRIVRRSVAQPGGGTSHALRQLWQAAKEHLVAFVNPYDGFEAPSGRRPVAGRTGDGGGRGRRAR
jgi:hypothetical protein